MQQQEFAPRNIITAAIVIRTCDHVSVGLHHVRKIIRIAKIPLQWHLSSIEHIDMDFFAAFFVAFFFAIFLLLFSWN